MKTLLLVVLGLSVLLNAAEPTARLDYRIVVTGGELLHGVYPDAHTHFLTRMLHPLGVHCVGSMIVDDVREEMIEALRFATNGVRLVIVTGGLGPTPNDITRETLAEFTGIPLRENAEVVDSMARRMKQPKEQLRANLRKQAQTPTRGTYLKSSNGTAVGLVFEMDSLVIVALPGPPRELQAMVVNELVPYLRQRFGVRPLGKTLTLRFVGVGQSQISQTIHDHVNVPPEVMITSLFEGGRVDFMFSLPPNTPEAESVLSRLQEQIREKLGDYLYADNMSSLEDVVVQQFKRRGHTLSVAEVATAGLLAAALNSAADAASVLAGEYVAPSETNLVKLLRAQSAPGSEACARELAVAAAHQTESAWGVAVGQPQQIDNATSVWAALKYPDGKVVTQRFGMRGSDDAARAQLVTQLLDWLRRTLRS